MEEKLKMAMLFDFFGELLTEKQREYFRLYYDEDLSLAEIAQNNNISKQGVRDVICRSEKILLETEKKTGTVERFEKMRRDIDKIEGRLKKILENPAKRTDAEINSIIELLQPLKI